MKHLPRLSSLLMVLCALLVAAQAGGAHVHYCLDGQGQAISVHYGAADAEGHDALVGHARVTALHSDVVVALGADAPLKKPDGRGDPSDPPALAPSLQPAPMAESPLPDAASTPARQPSTPHSLPPPARAPPR